MIFGALIHLEIPMARSGCKGVTWCTAPTTAYGWAISSTLIGICFNRLTLALSSTLPHEPSPAGRFTLVTRSESTTLSFLGASFFPTAPSSVVITTRFRLATASLKIHFTMERPCSKFGIITRSGFKFDYRGVKSHFYLFFTQLIPLFVTTNT